MMMICSCYSPDYTKQADRLFMSCAKLGLRCHLEAMEEMGSWRKNVRAKIAAVHAAVQHHDSVLWVDADATLETQPATEWPADFVARLRPASPRRREDGLVGAVSTGTMFLRRTPAVLSMLARWGHWQQQFEKGGKDHFHEPALLSAMVEAQLSSNLIHHPLLWEYLVVEGPGGKWAVLVDNDWVNKGQEIPEGTVIAHHYSKANRK